MSSASSFAALLVCACVPAACLAQAAPPRQLRVCADPNNLPYSNQSRQGFENRMAGMMASDLGMQVSYYWFPQLESFFRKTLNKGKCDVVMGVPALGFEAADTTRPYYTSTYAFVSRRDRNLHITSFDDPRLRTLRIGVQILDDKDDTLPPVYALTSRGIVRNLVGYNIFGNLNEKDPAADLIRAVEKGDVDVAVAWGPSAGYFARESKVPLTVEPVASDPKLPDLPFAYAIGIGVRHGDTALKNALDQEIVWRHAEIDRLLNSYGVPEDSHSTGTAVAEE